MKKIMSLTAFVITLLSCSTGEIAPFQKTADHVNLDKFMGDWYVIALLPTPFEKNAVNGIENYSLTSEGNIRVRYTFRKKTPLGKEKIMYQKGWIYNKETNADWRVSPLWPLKLPYYILEIDPDYSYTVIGTNNYDYLWIMSRSPQMDKAWLDEIFLRLKERGYQTDGIQFMEQSWGSE